MSDISIGSLNFVQVKFRVGTYDYVIYQGSPSGVYVKKMAILFRIRRVSKEIIRC